MKLEDEIFQKKFSSNRHKLSVNLIYTYHWQQAKMQQLFKKAGITAQQYNILRILRGQHPNPASIQLLKERMLDKQSDVSRLLDRIVAKGWAVRNICKDDRRRMDVLINETGMKLLTTLEEKTLEFEKIFNSLNDSEVNTLNDLLDKMRGE